MKKGQAKANIYGTHAVQAAWQNPERVIDALYITDQAMKSSDQFFKRSHLNRPKPTIIDKQKFDALCPRGAVHQGIAIMAQTLPEYNARDLIISGQTADKSLILMLDQVTDPHNVGAIIRSAAAFGATGIVMQSKHAPHLDGVLAKAASGGLEHIKIAHETNLSRAIEQFQGDGYFVYGLDERGENIQTCNPHTHAVLVLGAEGAGLRRLVGDHCDSLLRIPMTNAVASINVSNAAAVALYSFS